MVNASDLENNPNYPRHDNSERENWTFFYLRLNSADWTELDNKIEIITSQKTKLGQNNKTEQLRDICSCWWVSDANYGGGSTS